MNTHPSTWATDSDLRTQVDGEYPLPTQFVQNEIASKIIAQWGSLAAEVSQATGTPWALIVGIMASESWPMGYARSKSPCGAMGLMQVMPANFPRGTTDEQMFDPRTNVTRGAQMLAGIIQRRGLDVVKIAAEYNSGGNYARPGLPFGLAQNMGQDGTGYIQHVIERTNFAVDRSGLAGGNPNPDGSSSLGGTIAGVVMLAAIAFVAAKVLA